MRLNLSRILLGMTYVGTTGVMATISDIGLVRLSRQFYGIIKNRKCEKIMRG